MLADELNSEESRALLSAIDRMREILHDEKIRLPEIVVVGDQSVGKSSVLEAISGIQLPRAQNICTRCPLELRMKSTKDDEFAVIRSGTSSEDEAKTIHDFNDIAKEVIRLTNEITNSETDISLNPIYLTVYKRDIPFDLTLIDLPGITRNALPGQAKDIYAQILSLINKYIEPPTAVSPFAIIFLLVKLILSSIKGCFACNSIIG
jgi:GTPase SAR1 family protein